MPFCPSCRAEYKKGTPVCVDCQTQLVESLDSTPDTADMVDIYLCNDEQMADRVRALLEDEGIEVMVRDHASTAFPVSAGEGAEQRIAVAASQETAARKILADAMTDGLLAGEGELL